jgi:hypothetical protein
MPFKKKSEATPEEMKQHVGGSKGRVWIPQLLSDMRNVYNDRPVKGKGRDESPGVKALRKMLADKPTEFMTKMARMEGELKHVGRTAPKEGEAPDGKVDEGTERAIELVDRYLREANLH